MNAGQYPRGASIDPPARLCWLLGTNGLAPRELCNWLGTWLHTWSPAWLGTWDKGISPLPTPNRHVQLFCQSKNVEPICMFESLTLLRVMDNPNCCCVLFSMVKITGQFGVNGNDPCNSVSAIVAGYLQ